MIKLKRLSSLLLAVCCVLPLMLVTAFAASTAKVYDKADLFSSQEETLIQAAAEKFYNTYNMDIGVVTVTDRGGKTPEDFAVDFYDNNGFGYGANKDGLLLLIDIKSRDVYIKARVRASDYITNDRIQSIIENITPYLTNSNYFDGAISFINASEGYVNAGIPSKSILQLVGLPLIVGLVAGGIACIIVVSSYTSKKGASANSYLENHDIVLNDKQDILVNTFVTFTTNSSNNGGSTHRSSGGGGKF